jgi:hypothetical protein
MPFEKDRQLASDVGSLFGEYMITFISNHGQVRADLFRRGRVVEAHVSFPTGLDAGSVTDPYFSDLWNYARENKFQDQFKLVLSGSSSFSPESR